MDLFGNIFATFNTFAKLIYLTIYNAIKIFKQFLIPTHLLKYFHFKLMNIGMILKFLK